MGFGVAAVATGGRHHTGKQYNKKVDSCAVEYSRFDNETRFLFFGGTTKDGVRRLGDFGQMNEETSHNFSS